MKYIYCLLLFKMNRPSRNKKTVNYSDFLDNDEDFATVKAPPNKKARSLVKDPNYEISGETPYDSVKDISNAVSKRCTERVSLDEKLYKRDLEAALSLSLLQSGEKVEKPHKQTLEDETCRPPVLTHCNVEDRSFEDNISSYHPSRESPPVLSDCSVDIGCLGLASDQALSPATSIQKKGSKTTERQMHVLQDDDGSAGDEDFKPQNTPESDTDSSEPDESEDEEYTVKKKGEKKKTSRNEKKVAAKAVKKEKKTTKPQSAVNKATNSRNPAVAQSVSAVKRAPINPPTPKFAVCSSPVGSRQPKWNPPGLVGNIPTSSQNAPLKSPGLGLRLGLSRLARVKPLHPNATAH